MKPVKPFIYIFYSTLAQVIGFASASLFSFPAIYLLLIHITISSLITFFLSLPFSWKVLNIIIPIFIFFSDYLPNNSIVPAVLFAFLLFIFLPTLLFRVPFYPTSNEVYGIIETELKNSQNNAHFLDIGCGLGDLLFYLARSFPQINFIGVELSPFAYIIAKLRSIIYRNVTISFKNFWNLKFKDYTHIYAFLSPEPMKDIGDKILNESPKGSTIYVNSFEIPQLKPDRIIKLSSERQHSIFVYKV